ncbi:MAG: cytochrome PufQ [Pseudomonadota bacterium]
MSDAVSQIDATWATAPRAPKDGRRGRAGTHGKYSNYREYRFYFAVIFVLALPLAVCRWVGTAILSREPPSSGPVAMAWRQAHCIAPMIFSA